MGLVRGPEPLISSNAESVTSSSHHQFAAKRPSHHSPLDQHADHEQAHGHHRDCDQASKDQSNIESGRGGQLPKNKTSNTSNSLGQYRATKCPRNRNIVRGIKLGSSLGEAGFFHDI